MRVAVTGAAGRIGRAVALKLHDEGMEVIGLDKKDHYHPGIRMFKVDLQELGQVYGTLLRQGQVDAIVHLGAIPSPWDYPYEVVFANNVISQFNVFSAAANLGIRRVVSISSVSALGFPFQLRKCEPLYVPIDENHPLLAQDAYGLSKICGEEIAAAFCRSSGGSAASLRFSTVIDEPHYHRFITEVHQDLGRRAQDLWSYIDLRDAIESCILALTANYEGHHPFYIVADDTASTLPTDELLARWYPAVPRREGNYSARWSLLDTTKAANLLGFRPRYHWQEIIGDFASLTI